MNNSEMLLLKLGEVVLKGQNRRSFEDRIVTNVRRRLKKCGSFQVYVRQTTISAEPVNGSCDMESAWQAARQVFGVVSVARAVPCEKTVPAIVETARTYLEEAFAQAKSFKVESKRADKSFPMTSIQLSQYVGGELHDRFPHLTADMHRPELTVHVEVRDFDAYVHADPEPGAGGLPVGMGGRALSLLSGGIDSPVASWMIAKRGVIVDMIHYYSYPYTSPEAKEKVLELARLLVPYTGKQCVHVVPFTKIQEELRRSCPEELFTILMRRFMMRIACRVAEKNGIHALVTGESVGQVASQTLDAMVCTDGVCTLPVLRPLVGMDKEEIVRVSRKIGTFETSILPYEDCCTVFTPKHPRTKPKPEELDEAEQALDVEAMVADAVAGIERIMLDL